MTSHDPAEFLRLLAPHVVVELRPPPAFWAVLFFQQVYREKHLFQSSGGNQGKVTES
jgi:hypothetical protein